MRRIVCVVVAGLLLAGCGAQTPAAVETTTVTVDHTLSVTTTSTLNVTSTAVATVTYDPVAAAASSSAAAASASAAAAAKTGMDGYVAQASAAGIEPKPDFATFVCSSLDAHKGIDGTLSDVGGTDANLLSIQVAMTLKSAPEIAHIHLIIANVCPGYLPLIDGVMASNAAQTSTDDANQAAAKVGKYAFEGSHLVGTEVVPGKWRSVGDRVENCYWELSDNQGNILKNNYISVAPQFTITIPKSAAGFTNTGCTFEWISS